MYARRMSSSENSLDTGFCQPECKTHVVLLIVKAITRSLLDCAQKDVNVIDHANNYLLAYRLT